MYIKDIHSNNETINDAIYELLEGIKMAKRDKDKILCLITGYGSHGTSHKIKTAIEEKLDELLKDKIIKGWLRGTELDIFNYKYQSFPNAYNIPKKDKNDKNPGAIYIAV